MPKFTLDNVEDYFAYYVMILEVPEDVFWFCDWSFVLTVVANKGAYDNWLDYVTEREREKRRKK